MRWHGRRKRTSGFAIAIALLWAVTSGAAAGPPGAGEQQPNVYDPQPIVTPVWVAMQFVPSPGLAMGASGVHGTMTWHVTPILYSFGTDPRLKRFRWFVVEPLYRHSGSVELFVDPAYLGRAGGPEDRFGLRTGARLTFPLVARGDYLSFSVGGGIHYFRDAFGPSFEGGLSTIFGGAGLFVKVAPLFEDNYVEVSLRLRWF